MSVDEEIQPISGRVWSTVCLYFWFYFLFIQQIFFEGYVRLGI